MRSLRRGLVSFLVLSVLYGLAAQIGHIYLPHRVWLGPHYIENVEFLPTYHSLAVEAAYLIRSGMFLSGMVVTTGRVLAGFLVGTLVGLAVGSAAAIEVRFGYLIAPWATFVRFASPVVLLPLYVLWFGFSEAARILLIATGAGATIFIGTLQGTAQVPSVFLDSAAVLGLSSRMTLWRIVLPCAVPYIFTSLRVAVALAWTTVVVAELINPSPPSLGYYLTLGSIYPRVPAMVIGIVTIGILVLGSDSLMLAFYGRATRWMRRREDHASVP